MNIRTLVAKAYKQAKAKGFHNVPATFGDRIALCHTELSEAMEAFRELDADSYDAIREPLYRSTVTGNLTRAEGEYRWVKSPIQDRADTCVYDSDKYVLNKPEGVWSELADCVIRIADMCGLYGIDLEAAIERKLAYNMTRPMMHGKKRL